MQYELLIMPPEGVQFVLRAKFQHKDDITPWLAKQYKTWGWAPDDYGYCTAVFPLKLSDEEIEARVNVLNELNKPQSGDPA